MKPSYMSEEVSILPELFSSCDWFVCLGVEGGGAIGATLQPFGNLATVRTRQLGAAFCVDHGPFCLDWDCLASAKIDCHNRLIYLKTGLYP